MINLTQTEKNLLGSGAYLESEMMNLVYGPIPSRRLGKSLGVNNVAYKYCSYACIYCQIGNTVHLDYKRREFYDPNIIYEAVSKRIDELEKQGVKPDYISFVPDGEPTLDINLGKEIEMLKTLGYPVAVFTNSTLLWDEEVRREVSLADLVSVKVDAISEDVWRRVDRPPKGLALDKVLDGIRHFSKEYKGKLISETMIVNGIDYGFEAIGIADFLASLKNLSKSYINTPILPPAVSFVKPPSDETVEYVYKTFVEKLEEGKVESLNTKKKSYSMIGGNLKETLLSTLNAGYPVKEDELIKVVDKSLIETLVKNNLIKRINYNGSYFYVANYQNLKTD